VAVKKLRDILNKPSKNKIEDLRLALDYSSYDVKFLAMVANEFSIDISAVANRSRIARIQVLEHLIGLLE
jgi:hypothetical protein